MCAHAPSTIERVLVSVNLYCTLSSITLSQVRPSTPRRYTNTNAHTLPLSLRNFFLLFLLILEATLTPRPRICAFLSSASSTSMTASSTFFKVVL
ncbi:hypothetical protein HT594_00129 [Phenacoccus solenopsis nudivirus]|nr:hypothetical protein HT594_00129 [Phenacoccus solenopsis nudivirus]